MIYEMFQNETCPLLTGDQLICINDGIWPEHSRSPCEITKNYKAGLRMLNMAPGISYKLQQLIRATRTLHYADSDQRSGAWAKYGENPYLRATTTAGGFFFNLQAEESLLFLEQFADIMAEQLDMTQKVGRILGYSRYQLDIKPWEWDGEEQGNTSEPKTVSPKDAGPKDSQPKTVSPS